MGMVIRNSFEKRSTKLRNVDYLRSCTSEYLDRLLSEKNEVTARLRLASKGRQAHKTETLKGARKDVARIMTVIRESSINALKMEFTYKQLPRDVREKKT